MDEFVKRVAKCDECIHNSVCYMQEVCNDIEEQLREFGCDHYRRTADVVEVVRCRDCDLWNEWDSAGRREFGNYVCSCAKWSTEDGSVLYTKPNDFCSYGEPKEAE